MNINTTNKPVLTSTALMATMQLSDDLQKIGDKIMEGKPDEEVSQELIEEFASYLKKATEIFFGPKMKVSEIIKYTIMRKMDRGETEDAINMLGELIGIRNNREE